jgi:hypothetical protein
VALEGAAPDLVVAEGHQLAAQPGQLGVETLDLTEGHRDRLPPRGAQIGPLEVGVAVGVEQVTGEGGDPLMEQRGPDALHPSPALVGQRLVQPDPGPDLEDVVRGDPGLGQPTHRQQLPQKPGVGPVGLGPLLTAALSGRVGRLGQMGPGPDPMQFLDDEAPSRAAFQGEGHVGSPLEALEPRPHLLAVGGGDLAPTHLSCAGVHVVERDLPAMNVEPSYDSHGDLLELQQPVICRRNDRAAVPRRSPSFPFHIPCYMQ